MTDAQIETFERLTAPYAATHFDLVCEREDGTRIYETWDLHGSSTVAIDTNGTVLLVWGDWPNCVVEGDTSPLRRRVIMAVVYAVDVLPGEEGDEQIATYERAVHLFTEPAGTDLLFASGTLAAVTPDWEDPSFDVDVRSHGRTLQPIDFP